MAQKLTVTPDTLTAGQLEDLEDALGPGGFTAWRRKPNKLLIHILNVVGGHDLDELRALSVAELATLGESVSIDPEDRDTKASGTNAPSESSS